jgi:hypothetical protein
MIVDGITFQLLFGKALNDNDAPEEQKQNHDEDRKIMNPVHVPSDPAQSI